MTLMDILSPACIKAPLTASDKKGVIEELVDVLAAAGKVKDAALLKASVWSRETTRTTGIGHGLAIPHGKCDGVSSLAMAIGKPAKPIDFASIDGKPVRMIVLLASPPDKTSDHIQALARISRIMTVEDFRNRIYDAPGPQEIYNLLAAQEGAAPAKA
ncbi:MAG: PTS sugar transporter subunit IIA [Phycisphaerales bacterium]|nr:PTS sugar transporter subunit IIA [Phycisphaerales bacterium]